MKHRNSNPCRKAAIALALSVGILALQGAAPPTPQGVITGKAFTEIGGGTAVADLTGAAKFPDSPDVVEFLPYFEWNATGDINTAPGNWADSYGTQIIGYFYPPQTTSYYFAICADDNAELYLSTDGDPANKKLIARETNWSDPREYITSGGGSTLADKLSDGFTGSEWPNREADGGIVLQANQPYYIEALAKEGGGGDNLSVSVLGGGINGDLPIPGQYLSSDKATGPLTILADPQDQSVDERGSITFQVVADGTPPYTYQWHRDGADIANATGPSYSIANAAVTDEGARFSVTVTGSQGAGSATSAEALLTVVPDTVPPTVLEAKAAPTLTEVTVIFSEPVEQTSATTAANYQISSAGGALTVSGASLSAGGTQVTLSTANQTLGTKYTILVSNVQDTAATPNTIAANTKVIFFPTGALVELNGFVVFEVENYDELLGALWTKDTVIANASGGAYMRLPDNVSDNENVDQLLYNVTFAQTATYQVWYHASVGDSVDTGAADSGWFHLDGARPAERAASNDASMSGFNNQREFVWRSDAQSGSDPFTVDITAGDRVVGIAAREDGAHFDKMILTTDTSFAPTGFGPPETREGSPGLPTVSISSPSDGQTFPAGADVTITPDAAGQSGLEIVRVEYSANNVVIGESTTSPFSFTWVGAPNGIYRIRATATDEIRQSMTSAEVQITVGTPPPQVLFVVNSGNPPTVNASDGLIQARLESFGFQVQTVGSDFDDVSMATGMDLVVLSSTFGSGNVLDTYKDVAVPVINWEQAVQDDMAWTTVGGSADRGTTAGLTSLEIVDASHPLAAGLPAGVVEVVSTPSEFAWGQPNANANAVAQLVGTANYGIYGYETGALLTDNTPAAARRVMLFLTDNTASVLTEDGWKLVDAAIGWALDREVGVRPEFAAPTLADGNVTLSWTGTGTLEQAPSVTGPWSTAASQANPQSVTATGTMFYRIKQ